MLRITFANRLETLRNALLDGLEAAPASPFVAEQIIVPSSALRRDLNLAIAERFGICANVEFSFLAQWLWRQIGRVVPTVSAESPFASPVLAWRIFELFNKAAFISEFPRLAGYLSQTDAVARFDFAGRVAALFEQYMTYRPAWLAAWAAGRVVELAQAGAADREDQLWQAALWRAISLQLGVEQEHPASAFLRKVESLGSDAARCAGLPQTAHVFCLPTIPPLYLDLLRQLGRWIDLRLYVLNPCREYWFEIVDRRRLSWLAAMGEADYHETGNRLLAAWGKQSQSHIDLLLEAATDAVVDDGGFAEAAGESLLARLQNAILGLMELEPGSVPLDPTDRSIEIHVCHSLTRELEVLQDQLLALFASSSPPHPCDILVVTPDLEAAAPLVDAVFGNAPRDRFIPYSVTGRARGTVNIPARALLALLTLIGSRWTASAVFDLLQQSIIARRFGIGVGDLEDIQNWMRTAGIRWGVDAQHRAQYGLPGMARFSFDDGLQRLLLGYALPDGVSQPWHDLLPAGNAEGSAALLLGRFVRFVGELTRLRTQCNQAMAPAAWMARLFGLLETFLEPDDSEIDDLGEVRDCIRQLHANMLQGGVSAPITLDVLRAALAALLDDPARGGVAGGAVTFSSISSLRNLPFRVICAIGLNDGAFPSATRPLEFDLMALAPQRGDRQRRSDERNLFLDLLLAARDRFYLSYTGRGIRDNAPLPGSVLVSELIETLVPAIAVDPASAASLAEARRRLVLEHPLQPFARRCFAPDSDPRLRSFNRELCEARRQEFAAPPPDADASSDRMDAAADEAADEIVDETAADAVVGRFFQTALSAPGEEWRQVDVPRLIRFFRNPCNFLLRERLGIQLHKAGDELADEEPFLPDFLARQALAERLLPRCRDTMDAAELRHLAQAGIEYPPGTYGDLLLDRELLNLRQFADAVRAATAEPCLPPFHASLAFDLDGETWRLVGAYADLRAGGLVRQRYDDTRPVDYLEGWLHHLFLCAAGAGANLRTRWLSRNGEYTLLPCAHAEEILAGLMALYRRGLREPIHFFPKSAWKYVETKMNPNQAAGTWHNSRNPDWSESADPAYRLALRGVPNALDEDFEACARAVFGTLMDYLEDARL
jgi:exodeoxyribonuclease V gamma subunit